MPVLARRPLLALMGALALPRLGLAAGGLPAMVVHKDAGCGCCGLWIDHLLGAGFEVTARDVADMQPIKARLGVPRDLASCHTAEIAGYTIEGHVPAAEIKRLVQARPKARGLAVPGMPIGSPGMEVPGTAPDSYAVILFGPGASTRVVFARYRGDRAA